MIAVVACTKLGGIAHEGKTPWHLPQDLKFFWDITCDSVMIMGRKTYDSIPKHRLVNRDLIVFSKSLTLRERSDSDAAAKVSRCTGDGEANSKELGFVSSLDECLEKLKAYREKKICVTGGQDIFELFFEHGLIDTVFLTSVHKDFVCDRYFPLDRIAGWEKTCLSEDKEFSIHRLQR